MRPPGGYYVKHLNKNIRNTRSIIQYANEFIQSPSEIGIKTKGVVKKLNCSTRNFDHSIVTVIQGLLSMFEPQSIKIIIDPHFRHPKLSSMSMKDFEENYPSFIQTLPPLLRACVSAANGGSFLHSTMESEDNLNELLKSTQQGICFVYTDGEEVGFVKADELSDIETTLNVVPQFDLLDSIKVDAKGLLAENAIADPFEACQVIMIYQAPLFIGLECDVVVYVHNHQDAFEHSKHIDRDVKDRLKQARNEHHFLAVTRAKYQLIDISVGS